MLRDLYVAVEADADQPEASTKAVIPPFPHVFRRPHKVNGCSAT